MKAGRTPHRYSVYGVGITSDQPLALPSPVPGKATIAAVDFVEGTATDFPGMGRRAEERGAGVQSRILSDRSTYVRWPGLYEFRIDAGGTRIVSRPLAGCDPAVLQNFLFGPALSFALVQQGFEPLHAAVVEIERTAVALVGDCTFGKSTLLASFLEAGHRVLTDDLLIVRWRRDWPMALPGTGRVKLMPDSARAFLGNDASGIRLNHLTAKRWFAVRRDLVQRAPLPLGFLFALPTPGARDAAASTHIVPLSRAGVVRELLKNSFNVEILDRDRLARQFTFVTRLADDLVGARLTFPSGFDHLRRVRDRIVEYVRQNGGRLPDRRTVRGDIQ